MYEVNVGIWVAWCNYILFVSYVVIILKYYPYIYIHECTINSPLCTCDDCVLILQVEVLFLDHDVYHGEGTM